MTGGSCSFTSISRGRSTGGSVGWLLCWLVGGGSGKREEERTNSFFCFLSFVFLQPCPPPTEKKKTSKKSAPSRGQERRRKRRKLSPPRSRKEESRAESNSGLLQLVWPGMITTFFESHLLKSSTFPFPPPTASNNGRHALHQLHGPDPQGRQGLDGHPSGASCSQRGQGDCAVFQEDRCCSQEGAFSLFFRTFPARVLPCKAPPFLVSIDIVQSFRTVRKLARGKRESGAKGRAAARRRRIDAESLLKLFSYFLPRKRAAR